MADDNFFGSTRRVLIPPGVAPTILDYFSSLGQGAATPNSTAQTDWQPPFPGTPSGPSRLPGDYSQSAQGGTGKVLIPPGVAPTIFDYFSRLGLGAIAPSSKTQSSEAPFFAGLPQPSYQSGVYRPQNPLSSISGGVSQAGPASTQLSNMSAAQVTQPSVNPAINNIQQTATGNAALRPMGVAAAKSNSYASPQKSSDPSSIQLPQVYEDGEDHGDEAAHSYIDPVTGKTGTDYYHRYYELDPVSQESVRVHEAAHREYLEKQYPANFLGSVMAAYDSQFHNETLEIPGYQAQADFLNDYLVHHDQSSTPGWNAVLQTFIGVEGKLDALKAKQAGK